MLEEELFAVLRLQRTPKIGDIIAKKLIQTTGSASQIFKEKKSSLLKIDGIGQLIVDGLLNENYIKATEKEFSYIKEKEIAYSFYLNDNYPKSLANCIDSPILFFYDGNINWNNSKIISVVGTRNMTNYGRDFCNELIKDLTPYNPIIVSGFAYGVDICAHRAAIENDLQTIAVLAHGLDQIYPKTHKKYMKDVMNNGGFISEFWHDEDPMRENFLKRNRVVAGISKATIIIESANKGGSLVTADIANSYHRDVFAVPGRTSDVYSKGCNRLIKENQAHLLSSAEDIITMLNWDLQKETKTIQPQLFLQLTPIEQKVYDYLLKNGKQLLDVIALNCEIPVYQLSSILVQMELNGVVKPLPGKLFEV
ncbi:DNA-processing protein DprA [Tenacibaculum sp. M341]|uniref:DNA-processing protein DprA n=1 Tax=Tenacibaculum sp. M341 TaxID=2530339 RepID=UPI0010452172|nr:DNA-processing protein DprA [Tenacibaculum sp. M341]TCI92151.1 DNA-protecting protein DprA [Tenacibaculum sp. M341]